MPSLIPLDDNSQRSLAGGMPKPARRLIPIQDSTATNTTPSIAPPPAKKLAKQRTVSWLGESNLPVVGQINDVFSTPGVPGLSQVTGDIIEFPLPTKENPGNKVFLVPQGKGLPFLAERQPDGSFKKSGTFIPSHRPAAEAAEPQAATQETPKIEAAFRNRETIEKWKGVRPEAVAEMEHFYQLYHEVKQKNPLLAARMADEALRRYERLDKELGGDALACGARTGGGTEPSATHDGQPAGFARCAAGKRNAPSGHGRGGTPRRPDRPLIAPRSTLETRKVVINTPDRNRRVPQMPLKHAGYRMMRCRMRCS